MKEIIIPTVAKQNRILDIVVKVDPHDGSVHISHRDASADVKASSAGGSYTCRALRHSLI